MQKHHQKLALFSILAVALGSSLSWNPENTNIVRHVMPEAGETMLASEAFDVAPDKAAPVQPAVVKREVAQPVADTTTQDEKIARLEKEKEELKIRLAVQEELKKQKITKKERRHKEDEAEFRTIKVSEECKGLNESEDEEDDLDDEDGGRRTSKVASRLARNKSDSPRGEYLVCLKDQFVDAAKACSKKENKDLTKKERTACGKQAVKFFEKHIQPALAVDLKKGRDSEQLREALDMAADLIAEIPDVPGISKQARSRIRSKVSAMTADGAVVRGRDVMDETLAQYGDTPQTRAYALSKFREYVACEMGMRCNQMMLNQHGIPNSSFVGRLMNEAWLGGDNADRNGFLTSYFNSLMPYTKNGGPIDPTGATGVTGPVNVAPGARGNLPQYAGTFKPVPAANGVTSPQWIGPAPQRPIGQQQFGAPTFNGGATQPGSGAPYPTSGRPMMLPQTTLQPQSTSTQPFMMK